jgi:iron complex outermembrane recepter protein
MKKYCCYIVTLAAVFILLSFFATAQNGIVKGTVRGSDNRLPGATVSLDDKIMITDDNGDFYFFIKQGNYTIIITHAGYKKIKEEIKIAAGSTEILDVTMIPVELMGEVVVLGSRSTIERTNLNTPVPIDVFSSKKLVQTGQQGLIQMLNYLVPSFNANRQVLFEPVTLRGLDPDHVLILINGTRYHNTAWLNNGVPKSNLGRGSVGNDLNSIPFSAIEKIEILRDGASAQYGSDAIAGVINIRLKESTGKTALQLNGGQFYAGDGLKVSLGLNSGFRINKKGFLNYSADFRHQSPTSRGGEYKGTVYKNYPSGATAADSSTIKAQDDSMIVARGINRKQFSSNDGISQLNSSGILLNAGYPISKNLELFLTSAVNYQDNRYAGSYRFPTSTNQVNTVLYPDGFKPEIKITNWDVSVITGIRGDTKNKWHWELSGSYGNNSNNNYVSNTNNASQYALGKDAPTAFYLGKLIYKQYTNDISFAKDLAKKNGDLKLCNIAIGAEWRFENYQQKEGEEASYKIYDLTGRTQGGAQPSIGSIDRKNLVNENRSVSGAYIDLEVETKDHFLFDIASRYEYYSDFGGNLAGKVAVRYKVSEKFSLRAAVGNGFRAPAMQQRFYSGTQSFRGTALTQGIFSNNSEVTKAFGIPSLQAERTVNLGGGFTSRLSHNISLTVDAYWIQIKNRIVLSGAFRKTNPDVAAILVAHPNIDVVQFYTNAINTRTHGIDVVLNGNWNINKTNLGLTLAANFNRNTIFGSIRTTDKISDTTRYTNTLFGIEERSALEKGQPGEKIILCATADKGKFGFVLRNTFFGKTASTTIVTSPTTDTLYEFFSAKILTDISINYTPKSWLTITAGANNIFDVYPDRLENYSNIGDVTWGYSNAASPFGYNGGYYFVRMSFNF